MVADGLSRIPAAQLLATSISTINATLLENIKQSWENDVDIQSIISRLSNGEIIPKYSYSQGLLYRNGRLVLGKNVELQTQLMQFFHDSALGGHSGGSYNYQKDSLLVLVEGSWQRCEKLH